MRINLEFADSLKSEFVAHHLIYMPIVVTSAGSQARWFSSVEF